MRFGLRMYLSHSYQHKSAVGSGVQEKQLKARKMMSSYLYDRSYSYILGIGVLGSATRKV